MKCLIFAFLLLSIVFAASGQRELTYRDSRFQYVLSIDSSLSADSVNYNCIVKSVNIFRIKDHKMIQVITPGDNSPGCGLPPDQLFIIEDMNFDGVNDIRLVQFIPAAPKIPYYFWIYNATTNRLVRNKALEKITSPDFDRKRKLIFSFWRASCCDHGQRTYKYINGRPTLIEESEVAVDPTNDKKNVMIVKKFNNGRWKVTKTIEKAESN